MQALTLEKHIVSTPEVVGGKPRLAGRRITVQNIVIWHERMGYGVDEIAMLYNLTLSEIYSALAYYYDHKMEIDQSITANESFVEEMRQKNPSLLAQNLYERTS